MAQGLVHVWVPKPYKTMVLPLKWDALQSLQCKGSVLQLEDVNDICWNRLR